MKITHLKNKKLNMVDVSDKKVNERIAYAKSIIKFNKLSFNFLMKEGSKKGEIFNVARSAGILAGKKTSELIPLCHNINLSYLEIDFKTKEKNYTIEVFSRVKSNSKTGVEMEALTACSIASLTIYDMCKSIDKKIQIIETRLLFKSGGKSGVFSNDTL
tara:strand:+ start:436 stop:912 length:477 start_codon:yes stop_codon:yes gene_type:complete